MTDYRARCIYSENGQPLAPILGAAGLSATTAGAAATTAVSLAGARLLRVLAADEPANIRFGGASVAATTNLAESIRLVPGRTPDILAVPAGATHFSIIRSGGSDATVQLWPLG